MNIQFQKVKINNFMSIGEAEVDLMNEGFVMIEGINHCRFDHASSNGAGKSSIVNAVCFCLTGETSNGLTKNLENIFADSDDCWVELDFAVDNKQFKIRRIKTPKQDLKIWIDGEDKSGKGIRESNKILMENLPDLTSELIGSIIIMGQGLPHRFSNNTPAGRKEVLESLTKSDYMIQDIKDKLDDRSNEVKTELRKLEDQILTADSQRKIYTSQLDKNILQLDQYSPDIVSDIETLVSRIADNKSKLNEVNDDIQAQADTVNELIAKVAKLGESRNNEFHRLADKFAEDNNNLNEKSMELKAKQMALRSEINRLSKVSDTCPTCHQKLPGVFKPDTTKQQEEVAALQVRVEDLISKRDININKIAEIRKTVDEKYDAMETVLNTDLTTAKTIGSGMVKLRTSLTEQINADDREKVRLEGILANKESLENSIKELNVNINNLTESLIKLNTAKEKVSYKLSVISKMITLARRDFRGVLLKNIIDCLNIKSKEYCKLVFNTEELNIGQDDNAINIIYHNKYYEQLSGGEKQKIDIIIQLALRDILSKYLNIHTNMLVIDEIFDNMDLIGCQNTVRLITSINDICSVFIISHHAQDLNLTYDKKIIVEKNEHGVSSIRLN